MEASELEKRLAAIEAKPTKPSAIGEVAGMLVETVGSKKAIATLLTAAGGIAGVKEFAHSNPSLAIAIACCAGAVVCCWLFAQAIVDAAKEGAK